MGNYIHCLYYISNKLSFSFYKYTYVYTYTRTRTHKHTHVLSLFLSLSLCFSVSISRFILVCTTLTSLIKNTALGYEYYVWTVFCDENLKLYASNE